MQSVGCGFGTVGVEKKTMACKHCIWFFRWKHVDTKYEVPSAGTHAWTGLRCPMWDVLVKIHANRQYVYNFIEPRIDLGKHGAQHTFFKKKFCGVGARALHEIDARSLLRHRAQFASPQRGARTKRGRTEHRAK